MRDDLSTDVQIAVIGMMSTKRMEVVRLRAAIVTHLRHEFFGIEILFLSNC